MTPFDYLFSCFYFFGPFFWTKKIFFFLRVIFYFIIEELPSLTPSRCAYSLYPLAVFDWNSLLHLHRSTRTTSERQIVFRAGLFHPSRHLAKKNKIAFGRKYSQFLKRGESRKMCVVERLPGNVAVSCGLNAQNATGSKCQEIGENRKKNPIIY